MKATYGLLMLATLAVVICVVVASPAAAPPHLQKGDKLASVPLIPRTIAVEHIRTAQPLPEPKAPPERELLEANQPADTLRPPAPATRRDPCARWGGHKISTHGGRYWHCRY